MKKRFRRNRLQIQDKRRLRQHLKIELDGGEWSVVYAPQGVTRLTEEDEKIVVVVAAAVLALFVIPYSSHLCTGWPS